MENPTRIIFDRYLPKNDADIFREKFQTSAAKGPGTSIPRVDAQFAGWGSDAEKAEPGRDGGYSAVNVFSGSKRPEVIEFLKSVGTEFKEVSLVDHIAGRLFPGLYTEEEAKKHAREMIAAYNPNTP